MSSTSGRNVQFGPPVRGKEASSRPSAGRTCDEPGCPTLLSTYNAATRCWLHSDPSTRHALAKS
jgi:hypothetical protein